MQSLRDNGTGDDVEKNYKGYCVTSSSTIDVSRVVHSVSKKGTDMDVQEITGAALGTIVIHGSQGESREETVTDLCCGCY